MASPTIQFASNANHQLMIVGDWTLDHYHCLCEQLAVYQSQDLNIQFLDFRRLTQLDTVGSQLLVNMLGAKQLTQLLDQFDHGLSCEREALLRMVITSLSQAETITPLEPTQLSTRLADWFVAIGLNMSQIGKNALALVSFMGLTFSVMARIIFRPARWRVTSFSSHVEKTGFNALPIVILLTFLIGAVVAFLGATLLTKFGASIYTIHLVTYSFLREFGPLLAAIIMAARTASAFTAQIGSMRANEEIDAIRVLGLNAIELLVIPRLLALMVSLPILTFVAMVSGILGGIMVAQISLDISSTLFISMVQQHISLHHFWVGMAKAPFFAFIIVMISCLEGFKVSGSAQSVGEHTTASVVQSIFMIIVIDAIFAVICKEMGW